MQYSDKLKNPQWQKKRLEILQRDEWTCRWCGEKEVSLHVHHVKYKKGKQPWESDNNDLITVCEYCHESEHLYRLEAENSLINELKKYNHSFITEYMIFLHVIETMTPYPVDVILNIIEKTICNEELNKKLYDNYFEYISKKSKETILSLEN